MICFQDKKVIAEVAVKVIDRISLKKEKKLKENLEREISILKLMKECDYIVKIMDARVGMIYIGQVEGLLFSWALHMVANCVMFLRIDMSAISTPYT